MLFGMTCNAWNHLEVDVRSFSSSRHAAFLIIYRQSIAKCLQIAILRLLTQVALMLVCYMPCKHISFIALAHKHPFIEVTHATKSRFGFSK